MDDIVTGASEAFNLYTQAKEIFRTGEFNLKLLIDHDFSNGLITLRGSTYQSKEGHPSRLDETYEEATLGNLQGVGSEEHKVLGVRWNPGEDCLTFDVSAITELASTLEPTKRDVVSIIGRFFDPLGFLSPVQGPLPEIV